MAPLNRFDDIFDKAVKNHGFREVLKVQKTPFPPALKECLCQIMRVTTLLFENCSYRTIYGSALVYTSYKGTPSNRLSFSMSMNFSAHRIWTFWRMLLNLLCVLRHVLHNGRILRIRISSFLKVASGNLPLAKEL